MAIIPTPLVHHNAGLGGNGGLNDLTSGGRNLTIYNGGEITADTDSGGTAAFLPDLPTIDSHFADGAFADLDGSVTCTVSAWVKYESGTGIQIIVANHAMNKGNIQIRRVTNDLYFYNTYLDPTVGNTDNEWLKVIDSIPNADQWYHVLFTYDANEPATDFSTSQNRIICYIDGVKYSGTQQYRTNGTQPTSIKFSNVTGTRGDYSIGAIRERTIAGVLTGSIVYPFEGRIDDVRMWDTVLTQSQITSLSTSRNYVNSYPTGLGTEECWYCPSLDDSALDLTGNGNDGTYQGGMATVVDSDPTYGGTRAYSFDGIDDFIETLSPTMDTFSNSYSMSLWVKPSSVSVRQPYATLVSDNGDYRAAYAANEADGSHVCGHNLTGALEFVTSPPGTATVGWLHLCYTYDAVATFICNWANASRFDVGRRKYSTTEDYMTGRIDDLRFYQTVLTQEEIDVISTSRGIEGSGGGAGGGLLLLGVG
jgi:hypothetical protein